MSGIQCAKSFGMHEKHKRVSQHLHALYLAHVHVATFIVRSRYVTALLCKYFVRIILFFLANNVIKFELIEDILIMF